MEETLIFETHAHYDDERFDEDRYELLDSMRSRGIGNIVNVCASLESCQKTLELTKNFHFIYGAVGIHPNETGVLNEDNFKEVAQYATKPKVVAVGETGLDYYWDQPSKEVQKKWFIKQLELAKELDLPVIIHSRDAAKDTIDILKQHYNSPKGGIIHCFSYSKEIAKEYTDMNFYIGVGGVVTFSNAKKLIETVKETPIERIVLETDAPYLAPVPNRGKRNNSINLVYIASEIAKIKDIPVSEVIAITAENAKRVFGL